MSTSTTSGPAADLAGRSYTVCNFCGCPSPMAITSADLAEMGARVVAVATDAAFSYVLKNKHESEQTPPLRRREHLRAALRLRPRRTP